MCKLVSALATVLYKIVNYMKIFLWELANDLYEIWLSLILKYLVFQTKNLIFQIKNLVFRSETLDFDQKFEIIGFSYIEFEMVGISSELLLSISKKV